MKAKRPNKHQIQYKHRVDTLVGHARRLGLNDKTVYARYIKFYCKGYGTLDDVFSKKKIKFEELSKPVTQADWPTYSPDTRPVALFTN